MNDRRYPTELDELIIRKLDGTITPTEYEQLVQWLDRDPEAVCYYIDFTMLYVGLSQPGRISFSSEQADISQECYNTLFNLLAENEKGAPKIEMPDTAKIDASLDRDIKTKRLFGRVTPINLWIAIGSMAALLFMIAYATFYPSVAPGQVAVLSDSVNARWGDSGDIQTGQRLYDDGKRISLLSGCAKIAFDYGSEIIIEGPAEFSLLSQENLYLYFGKILARIPTQAVGFVVDTPSAGVVDLGTEFGVQVESSGSSSVHLFNGKASLLAGEQGERKGSVLLTGGMARSVDFLTGQTREVTMSEHAFVRRLDSSKQLVWRGEPLNLADIVGGGDGFETGRANCGIDPISGMLDEIQGIDRYAPNQYVPVPDNPFVDGVFVPNGKTQQVISSLGHSFEACPVTQGNYYIEVANRPKFIVPDAVLANSLAEESSILLHANLGITFDLNAIRSGLPGVHIAEFKTEIDISALAPRTPNADIWILVDGKLKYSKRNMMEIGKREMVSVALHQSDRFLTLIATDGGDPDCRLDKEGFRWKSIDSDWCVFWKPVLVLE
ncbi:MAG: hypothetical protein ABFD91_05230 [Anaerohalosphaeraceae bacterium]